MSHDDTPRSPSRRSLVAGLAATGGLAALLATPAEAAADPLTRRLFVEDFRTASDQQAWEDAVAACHALTGGAHLIASAPTYDFTAPIDLTGLSNVTIEGLGADTTTLRADPSLTGSLTRVFFIGGSASTRNITFRNLGFDGGMTGEPSGHARDGAQPRPFPSDGYLRTGIFAQGPHAPTSPTLGEVNGITVENCRFYGLEHLPVHVNGARNVAVRDTYFRRCKDVGFTFCHSVQFHHNRIEWSADNGVSLSRGCREVTCSGNTIAGSFFSGIFAGGFGDDIGPSHLAIVGNTVSNSGIGGIELTRGTCDTLVQGNVVEGVLRGVGTWNSDGNGPWYGVGIMISGMPLNHSSSFSSGDQGDYEQLAERHVIVGNLVRNAERCGILFHGTDHLTVLGNGVHNPGSEYYIDGVTPIPDDATYRNVGIGAFAPAAGSSTNTTIMTNQITDSRGGVMTYGIIPRQPSTGMIAGNVIEGAAQTTPEGFPAPTHSSASRPAASAFPPGSSIFDTTTNSPLWSDGSTWRDASGSPA
ncbi:right-handed parallel beta-helix repeat-containing protein [Ruania alkalisoli]|uniref:Right-handed parallel beta-helix repeat-containing protein n=1 Tax=Ruania alkalisoli TaxID=2779775 RepID=A0A7M1SVF1_9MICO|nr:right-handed parallel beta-helix repeat-containing protein [Ruania alkalisoli]QOR71539.1 right-handed parallel beta-helix repeat-containing protein [Ruania alkalisoli]